jgi:hypothetical protein
VSRADPFYSFFNNPLSYGLTSTTSTSGGSTSNNGATPAKSTVAFGSPTYGTAVTTTTNRGTGTTGGVGTATTGIMSGYPGISGTPTIGSKAPVYSIALGFRPRPMVAGEVQAGVRQVLNNSSMLGPDRKIDVTTNGNAVVLRGTVGSEDDRRLAESMVRLTPGVYEVNNFLQVRPAQGNP